MSVLTQGRTRAHSEQPDRKARARTPSRQPYIVMNGATMVSIAAIAITVIGLLYLIQTSQVAQLGYDMSRLQTQRDTLTYEISELEYELARHQSLQTVEQMAEGRLGMTELSNYTFVRIQEPSERELKAPEAETFEKSSLLDRVLDAVLGVGSANSETAKIQTRTVDEVSP